MKNPLKVIILIAQIVVKITIVRKTIKMIAR